MMNDEVGMRNAQCTMHNAEPGNGEPRRMDLEIEELGIRFTPLRSQDYWLVAAYWGDGRNRHVYSLRMEREGYGWRAVLENDGREVGSFSSTLSQYTAAHMALAALKAYIRRGHRRTLRTPRKERRCGMMPVSTASTIAFVTGMAALVGFVGMMADKHTQMVAFVGIAVAAFLYGYCLGALSTVGEAMKLIKEHEKEAAQQTQAQAMEGGAE